MALDRRANAGPYQWAPCCRLRGMGGRHVQARLHPRTHLTGGRCGRRRHRQFHGLCICASAREQRTSAFRGDFGCRNPRDDSCVPDTDCGDGLGLSPRAFHGFAHLDRCRWRGERGVAGCAVRWVDSSRGPVGNRGGWLCKRSICPCQCAIEISSRVVNPSLFTRSGERGNRCQPTFLDRFRSAEGWNRRLGSFPRS
jgi:hypothetical protein